MIEVFPEGRLILGSSQLRCALGRSGIVGAEAKREGDGATPAGTFPLRQVFFRPDRVAPPETGVPVRALTPSDGWGDDPAVPEHYNRLIALPASSGHERLWREDPLYDVILVIGFNDDPPVPGRGSAIFLHVARPDFAPTEGCVALAPADVRRVVEACEPTTQIRIHPPKGAA